MGGGDGLTERDCRRDEADEAEQLEDAGDGEGDGASISALSPATRGEGVGDGVGNPSLLLKGSDSGVSESGRRLRLAGRGRLVRNAADRGYCDSPRNRMELADGVTISLSTPCRSVLSAASSSSFSSSSSSMRVWS